MDPLISSQTLYTTLDQYRPSPSIGNELDKRISKVKSIAHLDSQKSSEKTHASFLHKRLSHFTMSIGNVSFTLDDFLSNPGIREKVLSEIQKILAETINSLANDTLNEIRNAKDRINTETAGRLSESGLKLIKEVCKSKGVDSKFVKDLQAIFPIVLGSGSIFSNVSDFGKKLKNGEIKFDPNEFLKQYYSFHDFVDISYDAFSSVKDTVGLLDDNLIVKKFYEVVGLGKEFTPFASEFVSILATAHTALAPVRLYLKGSKFYKSGRKWLYFDKTRLGQDRSEYDKLVRIRRKLFKNSLDLSREIIKTGAELLVITGIIASSPVTTFVAILSITSLSIKIYDGFKNPEKPPKKENSSPLVFCCFVKIDKAPAIAAEASNQP